MDHFVLLWDYSPVLLAATRIRSLIEACTGDDWDEISEKVSRIGFWEFEDYRDSQNG